MKKILCIIAAVCVLVCTACTNNASVEPQKDKANETQDPQIIETTLYFSDEQAISLVGETREFDAKTDNLAKLVMHEIIKGPESENLINLIPEGTTLNAVSVDDGLCTVDLSMDFIEKAYGTLTDTLCVYSIVNSLSELEGVDEVQFLIDGNKIDLFGDFVFDAPFKADSTLNK